MILHVLGMVPAHDKIFRAVVLSVEVLVMNLLSTLEWTTDLRLRDDDVLEHIAFRISSWVSW